MKAKTAAEKPKKKTKAKSHGDPVAQANAGARRAVYDKAFSLAAPALCRLGREIRCLATGAGDLAWAQAMATAFPKAKIRICCLEPEARKLAVAKRLTEALNEQYRGRVRMVVHRKDCALADLPTAAKRMRMETPDILHVTIGSMDELDEEYPFEWPMRRGFIAVTFDQDRLEQSAGKSPEGISRIASGGTVFGMRFNDPPTGSIPLPHGLVADFHDKFARAGVELTLLDTWVCFLQHGSGSRVEGYAIFQRVN
ncbi:MAG TPA: hypothetical protein PLU30_25545 [Verrucomicrobiae bacterium]|nr:hypothetical protein [Verrucomicrobiae bacterium]